MREVFGKGNDFAAKITYNARNAKEQLQAFRTSPTLRIAVTVDMIATGTDVKPLECVFFMRDVRSAQYFEQMKGRGARTISSADFPGRHTGRESQDPVRDRRRGRRHRARLRRAAAESATSRYRLKKLLDKAANLTLTEDEAATLASRLAKLELDLTDAERAELDEVAGQSVRDIVKAARRRRRTIHYYTRGYRGGHSQPIAANPELRNRILELRAAHDRVIDEVSADELARCRRCRRHGPGPVDRGVVAEPISTSIATRSRDPARLRGRRAAHRLRLTSKSWLPALHGHLTIGLPTSSGTPTPRSTPPRCVSSSTHTAHRSRLADPVHDRSRRRTCSLR